MKKSKTYTPELGQMVFGCPVSQYRCPNFVEAGLALLAEEIERVQGNITQKQFIAPTRNCGTDFKTKIFKMYSYHWGDDEKLCNRPNFKYKDFEVRWYKYLGRGMSMNKNLDANTFFSIIDKCIENVRKLDVDIFEEKL